MSGYCKLSDLEKHAVGLNIEGHRPSLNLPSGCKWFNIVQVIDEPLNGINFDDVMERMGKYQYIEQAVGIEISNFMDQLVDMINKIAKDCKKILVHVHQYENSTILHKTLEKITKQQTICDKTHYYAHPVNYKIEYPDIDGLVSISQCAGIGLSAGSWIIPTGFMHFDVKNNIIHTNVHHVNNHVEPYINFDHIKGTILVVDDLWNPNLQIDEGVLLIDKDDEKVLTFVKEHTKIFDDSHNWLHAIKVAYNSTKILNTKLVLYLALLHDVCDHKYKNSIPREFLRKFIFEYLIGFEEIDDMIEQISFSKQDNRYVEPTVKAVRDGDRLEAIGAVGLDRCIKFVESKGGKIPDDVIQHCYDKLLKLVPDGYITLTTSAIERHNIIVDYVRDNIHKTNLTYDLPNYIKK